MAIQNGLNAPYPVGQSGKQIYAASATGNDTYVITLDPVPEGYVNGMTINFKADVANTGAATLNVNGLGAIAITKAHDVALNNGDIEANQIVQVIYNSTGPRFQMQSQGGVGVNNLSGTANQVDVTAAGAPQTASLSATLVFPGTATLNADPVTALQAATKQYVDAVAGLGIEFKASVVCATTTALTVVYANGAAGVGATLTNAGAQAAFSTDGITPAVGSRILVKNQASTFQNGIYTLTNAGSGATNWVLTRAVDFDTAAEIQPGSFVAVDTGATLALTSFLQSATVVTVGTDPIAFSQFTYGTSFTNLLVSNALTLSALTASKVMVTDGSKVAASSSMNSSDLPYALLQNGAAVYSADTGAANAYVVTLSPVPAAYVTGMTVSFKAANSNTTTSTLNVNGLGAVTIKKAVSSNLASGDILVGQMVTVNYDGTNFQLNPPPSTGTGSVTSVATAGLATGGPITTTGTVTVPAATQADQETSTSNTVAVTPGVQKFHPSSPKLYVTADTSGTITESFGVTSITDGGNGLITVTPSTAFSTTNYCAMGTAYFISIVRIRCVEITNRSVGSFNASCTDETVGLADPTGWQFSAWGDL